MLHQNFIKIADNSSSSTSIGFHEYLLNRGIDGDNLEETAGKLSELSSTGGSGGVIDAFYQVQSTKYRHRH